MENMGGVRHLINRQPLPLEISALINGLENVAKLKVDDPQAEGEKAVRDIMVLVDGNMLMAGILAGLVDMMADRGNAVATLNAVLDKIEAGRSLASIEPEPKPDDDDDDQAVAYAGEDEDNATEAEALFGDLEQELEQAEQNPLDHDGDGKAGGSLPGAQSTRTRGAAKAKKAATAKQE